jgi:serine/threonine protein kinase
VNLAKGARLGPYEIVGPLGAGGMGEVYRATDTRLGRSVAVKIVSAEFAGTDGARFRFEREARAIAALSHPHICTLHDIGRHDAFEYLVMEFLEGETLGQRLERGRIDLDELVRFGAEIADALDAAHSVGITHRDIKPSNIMITSRGSVKILDFGVAKLESAVAEDRSTDVMTAPGVAVGTIGYMSPEQTFGQIVTPSSDLFSLGIVLYQAATGTHPFFGYGPAAVMQAIASATPVAPNVMNPEIPSHFAEVLMQLLQKSPAARPTARELRESLEEMMKPSASRAIRRPEAQPARPLVAAKASLRS